jgi:8-hydroxy-5-deazaflavin:NADPH oxidoreductase
VKVGIIGSGDVGRRLASGLTGLGHSVTIGTRNPDKPELAEWAKSFSESDSSKASIGTFEKAASFGDLIILSTLWDGTKNAINMAGLQNFGEKVVIDTTNPLDFSKGTPPSLSVGHTDSAGEKIQRLLPSSKVVKAFNTVGNPHMVHPDFPNGPPTMFICGNDENAKKMVTDTILTPFGWDSADIGSIRESRLLESLAMLWVTHYFRTGTGNHAFKLLRK